MPSLIDRHTRPNKSIRELRSGVLRKRSVEANKQWSKSIEGHEKVEYNLQLLQQHGGLENFKHYIAPGRAKAKSEWGDARTPTKI